MSRPTDWHILDLDRDPVPGDSFEVKDLAKKLTDFADDVSGALRSIRGLSGDTALLDWVGLSGDEFRTQYGDLPKELDKLERSYRLAGGALDAYWPQLEHAQRDADRALEDGRAARDRLSSADSGLSAANDAVLRANAKPKPGVPPPSPDEVKAAARSAVAASQAQSSAQGAVRDAQSRLDAAKKLAKDAADLRDTAANTCKQSLHDASDAGIKNKHWWEKAVDWVADHWDDIVAVCKVIVAVLGVIVMIIGGPLAWLVLAAALVVLADTVTKYLQGKASLWDVLFAALDCIPMFKGLTTAGGLLKMLKEAPELIKSGKALENLANGIRKGADFMRSAGRTVKDLVLRGDPVDMATGEMVMSATDVALPGLLPVIIERTHRSSYRGGRWFGKSWASTLDQRLLVDDQGVRFTTSDGMVLYYPVPRRDTPILPVHGPRWPLTWTGTGDAGGMTVDQPETGLTLHFRPLPGHSPVQLPLTRITDRNSNSIEFSYTEDGRPTELVHHGGYRVGVEWTDGGDRIAALRLLSHDHRPLLLSYGYDPGEGPGGDLCAITNSSGLPLTIGYDRRGAITSWQDRNGTWYRYTYDDRGRCVHTTGPGGILDYSYVYDEDARTTRATNSLGHRTTFEFNDAYQLVRETDPLGHATVRSWDTYGRLLTLTDPLGRTTHNTYDADGNLTSVTSPDGSTVRAEFDDRKLVTATTDADGSRWTYTYDERGNQTAVTDPLGATTAIRSGPTGAITGVTDPLGAVTCVESDSCGLAVKATDPLGSVTAHTRDAYGRVVSITDPLGATTHLTWTADGKPATRTGPDGATESWRWDGEGNLTAHTDAAGATTTFEYGHFDRIAALTGPDGARREFRYDTELQLTEVIGAGGLTWTYQRDEAGRLVSETDFNGRTVGYVFDAAGQLAARTNGAEQSTHYIRDLMGRILRSESEGAATTFAYDHAGKLCDARGPGARVEIERDRLGRLLRETVNGRTTNYRYDILGRRTHRTTAAGVVSEWSYDATGRPVELRPDGHRVTFAHDAGGREALRTVGGKLRIHHTWDSADRIRTLAWDVAGAAGDNAVEADPLGRREFSYAPGGRLTAVDDTATGSRRLDLDPVGRITAVHAPGWTERYTYDLSGNLTASDSADSSDGADAHTYNGNRVRDAKRDHYAYDDQGRVVRRTRRTLSGQRRDWTYTWDADDRLTDVVTPDRGHWRYTYDPLGRRIAKARLADDGSAAERVEFVWDGDRLIEQILHTDDGLVRSVTWDYAPGSHRPITQIERSGHRDAPQDEIDRRFHAIVTDLVGTPTELLSPEGETAWRRGSTLWGIPLGAPPTGDAGCPLRFPGQYFDEESGLHYNRNRYYDPGIARYLSPDPLGLAPGPDHYAYVSNPYLWADPLGLQGCPIFSGIQWMTGKMLERVSFRYQKFVTGQKYEQVWKLDDGRMVHLDGGPTAGGYLVEAKWTGNDHQWAASPYNPASAIYDENKIVSQAQKLLDLNEGLGGNGVRYAVSNVEGAQHFTDLLKTHFPEHFNDGRLNVFHVPGNGMSRWTK